MVIGEDDIADEISNLTYTDNTAVLNKSSYISGHINGVNKYYSSIAEKYEMPDNVTAIINSISFDIHEYKMSSSNQGLNITFAVYGNINGELDPENKIGTYTTSIENALGYDNITIDYEDPDYIPNTLAISFETPIEVTGTYFIAIELDADLKIEKSSSKFSFSTRSSIFSIAGFQRADKITSAYVCVNEYGAEMLDENIGWQNLDLLKNSLSDYLVSG